jgi:hypothetical protein
LSLEIIHQCNSKYFFEVVCISFNSVALTILHIFFIHDSSICLTLSLVIEGVKELPIFCRVSFSEKRPTLLSITLFSFSESELNLSLK